MEALVTLEITECCACGVVFSVPALLLKTKRDSGGYINCPNGHSIGWGEGKTDKALRIAEEKLEQQRKMIYEFSARNSKLEASNRAFKAANTRLKNLKKKGK